MMVMDMIITLSREHIELSTTKDINLNSTFTKLSDIEFLFFVDDDGIVFISTKLSALPVNEFLV